MTMDYNIEKAAAMTTDEMTEQLDLASAVIKNIASRLPEKLADKTEWCNEMVESLAQLRLAVRLDLFELKSPKVQS